jgi:DNA polymerase-1
MKSEYLDLIENLTPHETESVLLIDGFNLFMRNFAMINYLNNDGGHIGGLGGFLRSLGFLVKEFKPTEIYILFDGIGSSLNRKNLIPEYKESRKRQKLTNKNIFSSVDEEVESKVNQITRLIQYLNCLPVKIICLDRVEADDIIGYLVKKLDKKTIIVSSDADFLQLLSDKVLVYRPQEKVLYNKDIFTTKYNIIPENYLVYKTLVGDSSDNIKGIKDVGPKTLFQKFPAVQQNVMSLDDVLKFSEENITKHVIYARVLAEEQKLRDTHMIMDLNNPLVDDDEKKIIDDIVSKDVNTLDLNKFMQLFNLDGLIHTIRNINLWLREFIYLIPQSK